MLGKIGGLFQGLQYNDKKVYKQKCFSVIAKNVNCWEVSTESLFTFKRWYGVNDETFSIMGFHWKIWFLDGRGSQKPIKHRDCLKRGAWIVPALRESLAKKSVCVGVCVCVFGGRVNAPRHTMATQKFLYCDSHKHIWCTSKNVHKFFQPCQLKDFSRSWLL